MIDKYDSTENMRTRGEKMKRILIIFLGLLLVSAFTVYGDDDNDERHSRTATSNVTPQGNQTVLQSNATNSTANRTVAVNSTASNSSAANSTSTASNTSTTNSTNSTATNATAINTVTSAVTQTPVIIVDYEDTINDMIDEINSLQESLAQMQLKIAAQTKKDQQIALLQEQVNLLKKRIELMESAEIAKQEKAKQKAMAAETITPEIVQAQSSDYQASNTGNSLSATEFSSDTQENLKKNKSFIMIILEAIGFVKPA